MPRKKNTTTGADHAQDAKSKAGSGRNPGGKPRKIRDADELARVVEEYINYNISCNQDGNINPPTDYDFCKFSGIGNSTLNTYIREEDTYQGYRAALKKLLDYREAYFVKLSVTNPKTAGAAIFALKQPKNGGYADKPVVNIEARELKIVHGDGMTGDSFK